MEELGFLPPVGWGGSIAQLKYIYTNIGQHSLELNDGDGRVECL